jgi:hypothetical protein
VTHEGNDITDTGMDFKEGQQVGGIDIVLTQRVTDASGTVQDSRAGEPKSLTLKLNQ